MDTLSRRRLTMSEPRILIAGSAYIHNEGLRELCRLWTRVVSYLDPNVDVVIIDSVSPFEPAVFLDWPIVTEGQPIFEGGHTIMSYGTLHNRYVYRFNENIGHLSRGGEDGAGRTFCKSIELGIEGGYDYVAVIETDLIFLRSVTDICKRMQRTGVQMTACPNAQYQFPEFGACFIDTKWAKEFDLIGKYNWKKSQPWPIPEIRLMNIVQDYLMLLPIYGMRVDQIPITPINFANYWPYYPCAWLTHAEDFQLYLKAINMNGITLK
jgi:hypothetical protein